MSDPKAKRRVAATKRCTKNLELIKAPTKATATKTSLKKNKFALLQTLRLFQLVQFVKCCQFLLEINS